MATLKEIKRSLEITRTLKEITSTYYEIANLKMKQIKESVLKHRELFKELVESYQRIESAFLVGIDKKAKEMREKIKKKPEILVFLSANEFLYGSLLFEIWQKVKKYLKRGGELAVVGKVGRYFVEKASLNCKVYYFELEDEKWTDANLIRIIQFIKNYERILVFFGRYYGGLIQKPIMEKISGKIEFEEKPLEKKSYLFEPSPSEILDFFEEEILGVLFNITLLEHQLAKLAARTFTMFEASEKAKKLENELLKKELKLKKQLRTKKQIEIFNQLIS